MSLTSYGVETVVSAPLEQNAFIVWRRDSTEAVVVDPGFDVGAILGTLVRHSLRVVAILNTHGHYDHIAGNARLKQVVPKAPLIIGKNEASLLGDPAANLSAPFGLPQTSPAADRLVEDGERLQVAGFSFLVREIPGHSPGSVVFIADGEAPPFVLGGDVLFAGSVGRVDFPGGSGATLLRGIRTKLLTLPQETIVFPGHGPATTIGEEMRTNPFLSGGPGRINLE